MIYHRLLVASLIMPLWGFAQSDNHEVVTTQPHAENSLVKTYTNESAVYDYFSNQSRTRDYPTHIIRLKTNLDKLQKTCQEVQEEIQRVLINKISHEQFFYNTFVNCVFNPETHLANTISIQSYFDPLSDTANDYLQTYLRDYNNSEFLGTRLHIERAKALVISLGIKAGIKNRPNTPPFIEYRADRRDFYFKNNYDMVKNLHADIYQNFFSNEPDKILPFLKRWLFEKADLIYKPVLRDANFVELQPERIFLMEEGEAIFVSELKFRYAHQCKKYENQRCLKN